MKSLLIIGGTGFFGKSFLDSFQCGDLAKWNIGRIIAMSRRADRLTFETPQLLDERVELINADIATVDSLPFADYVIHAAASTDTRNYLSRPEIEKKNIQSGVHNYCRLAPKFHSKSKIVYVSSGAVYGVQPVNLKYLEENSLFTNLKDMPEHKRDYAVAKRDAEHAFSQLSMEYEIKLNIARCFSFVGPWLPRDQHFAIGNFIRDGLGGKPINVKSTFPVYRSYMHAKDLIYWLMTIAEHSNSTHSVFNVGSDFSVEMRELAFLIAGMCGVSVNFNEYDENKIDRYIPSIKKAKECLGLSLTYSLSDAIKQTIGM